MEEIDIREIFSYFLNKIVWFSLIVAIVVVLFCGYYIFVQKPEYTSRTSIILTGLNSTNDPIAQNDISVNQKLVSTYQEIVKSKRVLNQVVNNLNLSYTTEELSKMIKVTAKSDTEIIEVSVTCLDNNEAYRIAKEVAKIFSKEAKDLYNLSNISTLDEAEINYKPSNVNIPKQIAISVVAGFLIAFVVMFTIYYFDTTIKNSTDIEKKFGLVILGNVPNYNKKKKGNKNE